MVPDQIQASRRSIQVYYDAYCREALKTGWTPEEILNFTRVLKEWGIIENTEDLEVQS